MTPALWEFVARNAALAVELSAGSAAFDCGLANDKHAISAATKVPKRFIARSLSDCPAAYAK
jgi:hypothetical protein